MAAKKKNGGAKSQKTKSQVARPAVKATTAGGQARGSSYRPLSTPAPAPDNPPLDAWLQEYARIYDEWMNRERERGGEFGEPYACAAEVAEVKARLREKGVTFRNGEASLLHGPISTACVACTGDAGSESFFYSLRCPKNCFFCFNHNQESFEAYKDDDRDWRAEFAAIQARGHDMTHVALTGGEPLMRPDEACEFFATARANWPNAHLRLYTSGEGLTRELMARLVDAGMNEIRFSIKNDIDWQPADADFDLLRMSCEFPVDTMVEMPVMPGTFDQMTRILDELDAMGAFGINLLEFCYAKHNWPEFARRGFKLQNPPFTVLYDWAYAGAMPVEGSELEAFRLLEYAADRELKVGVHYCSLENKHRSQVFQHDHMAQLTHPCFALDPNDFYYKTCKVFGRDVAPVRTMLEMTARRGGPSMMGTAWEYDPSDDSFMFHPRFRARAEQLPVRILTSVNILEQQQGGIVVRELGLYD